MDCKTVPEMFESCDNFPRDEISSSKRINISLLNHVNESSPHLEERHHSMQEFSGVPVLFSGRSYIKKVKSTKVNVNVHQMKRYHGLNTVEQADCLFIQPSHSNLPKSNFGQDVLCFSSETRIYPEMRDIKAPISDSKDEDTTRITGSCYKEKKLQNPALKDLIKNIETFYQDNENASTKNTSTKRINSAQSGSDTAHSENVHDRGKNVTSNDDDKTIWYECQKCYLQFSSPKGLANHVKTHPRVMIGKNACVYCGKKFDNANDLNDHLNAEHLFDIINYTCESCQVECICADLFDKHQYACHRKQDTLCLFCSNCDKVYYDQDMHNYHKEQLKYCHICSLSYCMSSSQFKVHKEKHILFKYKCLKCSASFVTKASLTKHLETKNLCFQTLCNKDAVNSVEFDHEKVVECDTGLEEIEDAKDGVLEEGNILSAKKEKTHKCPLCRAKFALVKNMWRHVAVVHPSELQVGSHHHIPVLRGHQCTMCEKKVTKKSNLVAHMASHIRRNYSTGNGEPKCSICHKTFRLQRYLVDHMRLHTGRGTHQCRHCDKKFLRLPHLKLHMQMHDNFQRFHSCPCCDKTYMRKRDQVHHMRVKHGTAVGVNPKIETGGTEGFSCSECDKKFSSVLQLQMHGIRHTATKPPYKCQECFQDFPTLSTLKRHYLIHWDLRPFSCSLCSKSFRYAQSLKRHMMTHTGEKPHVCKHCGKGFALKGTLQVHLQQHSSVRTFKCYKCDEVFTSKRELKSHHCCQMTKVESSTKSVSSEYCVVSKANVYVSYADDNNHGSNSKDSNDVPVTNIVPNALNDITSVTTLISDTCVGDIVPVTELASNSIPSTVTQGRNIVTEVDSEAIPIRNTISNNSITGAPYESQFSNNSSENFEAPQIMEGTHLQNVNPSNVLSQAYSVVNENITDCVSLSNCSVLETNQDPDVGESTIYTLVTIDSKTEHPTFINIPTISNSGSAENVTLQINFPEEGCSEVFIIKS